MSTNEELIGRDDINDLEAILAVTNTDVDEVIHAVKDNAEAIFTWDYEKGQRPALNGSTRRPRSRMWNGETDLPWDTEVDQEKVVAENAMAIGRLRRRHRRRRHPVREVGPRSSGSSSASRARTGCSASSCTASRAR